MACGNAQGMIRVVSQKLYGDSKYLEKHLLGKLIAVLGELDLDLEDREETRGEKEERLLRLRGLVPYPEILAFCGKIEGVLDSGETFTTKNLPYGTYLDAQTVDHLREVRLLDTTRIFTIENKANYYGRLEHWQEGELILFHGGFYSPVKGRFYRLIAKAMDVKAEVFHWGDIDLGGFRMFHRLQEEIFPSLRPYRMDEKTLRENLSRATDLGSKEYRDDLASLLENPGYQVFYEVIRSMLKTGKKLEQEALLL